MAVSATSSSAHDAMAAGPGSMLSRLRAWIAMLVVRSRGPLVECGGGGVVAGLRSGLPQPTESMTGVDRGPATMLQFPRSGHWHLAQLARELRQRFAAIGLRDFAPFLIEIEPGDRPRLWIDQTAYAECCGLGAGFRVVLNDAFQVRITIETQDFRAVEALVGHYIVARLAEVDGEAA
jgi:hypothetical protein